MEPAAGLVQGGSGVRSLAPSPIPAAGSRLVAVARDVDVRFLGIRIPNSGLRSWPNRVIPPQVQTGSVGADDCRLSSVIVRCNIDLRAHSGGSEMPGLAR